jgi:hypothetical protein
MNSETRRIGRHSVRVALLAAFLISNVHGAAGDMEVYKTPTCGCCEKWVEHVRANGFRVVVHEVSSTAEHQKRFGVPQKLASCHTARVGGYTIEGHVPAADVQRLLKTRPKAVGLAVPGMPMGSPGMEGPRADPYSVLLFQATGRVSEFRNYPAR